jgi:hypothetical protein
LYFWLHSRLICISLAFVHAFGFLPAFTSVFVFRFARICAPVWMIECKTFIQTTLLRTTDRKIQHNET